MTWTGRQGSLEPAQFFDFLFESKVENIEFVVPSTGDITTRKLVPHGTCKVYEGRAVEHMAIDLKTDAQSYDYFVQISRSNYHITCEFSHLIRVT